MPPLHARARQEISQWICKRCSLGLAGYFKPSTYLTGRVHGIDLVSMVIPMVLSGPWPRQPMRLMTSQSLICGLLLPFMHGLRHARAASHRCRCMSSEVITDRAKWEMLGPPQLLLVNTPPPLLISTLGPFQEYSPHGWIQPIGGLAPSPAGAGAGACILARATICESLWLHVDFETISTAVFTGNGSGDISLCNYEMRDVQ